MVKITKAINLIISVLSLCYILVVAADYLKLRENFAPKLRDIIRKKREEKCSCSECSCETETPSFDSNEDIEF